MKPFSRKLPLALLTAASALALTVQAGAGNKTGVERTAVPGSSARAAAQTAYELRCRGGEGLKFTSTPGRYLQTGEQMMNMTVEFIPGTQGTGDGRGSNLNPGQCSWVDRGFREGEPTQIRLEIVGFGQLRQVQHGSAVDRTPSAAERFPDAQNLPQYLSDPKHHWRFRVYNTSQGYLQATGHGLWKPVNLRITDKPDRIKDSPLNPNKPE